MLAPKLRAFARRSDVVVAGVLTGGLVVAAEIARRLHVALDFVAVQPLRVPGQEDLIFGAVGPRGPAVHDAPLVTALGLTPSAIRQVVQRGRLEAVHREQVWREHRLDGGFRDLTVIIVDEGIATGHTMQAAIRTIESDQPQAIVLAAPLAALTGVVALRAVAAEIVTIVTAERVLAFGEYYRDYRPVANAEVHRLLDANRRAHPPLALPRRFRVPAG